MIHINSPKDLYDLGFRTVVVLSYGYTEISYIGSHFEPFKHRRELKFTIDKDGDLYNRTFWFANESKEDFYIKDGIAYCNDPELYSRPDY